MDNPQPIPFNRAEFGDREEAYALEALRSGKTSGDGPFGKRAEALLAEELGAPRVLLTTSCTHALEMTALLLDLEPGDEVIVPSFTFVSTVNAFVLRGARPVFVDVREDTLNLNEELLEDAITDRTRAIYVVHYAGVACDMDRITAVASARGIPVIEDNAHGVFASYRGRPLGTFGAVATLSFHETKNYTCGEGGALILNDASMVERAEIIREKGTNRSRFLRGQVDKYTWVDVGSSYILSDTLAGVLLAQLERREEIRQRRAAIWERYHAGLRLWARAGGALLPTVPEECGQGYHLFYVLMPTATERNDALDSLRAQGISATFHYLPLHLSDVGRRFGYIDGDLPVTESVSERLLRLPFYNGLTEADQGRVIAAVERL